MSAAGNGVRLLYIDDDRGLSRLVEKELTRHGYDVTCALDGDAGLERLREGGFDVIALDHYMPTRDGLDVLPDILAVPGQFLLDQPGKAPVVVDVEQPNSVPGRFHQMSGACITDRKRPSCRIAPAKAS